MVIGIEPITFGLTDRRNYLLCYTTRFSTETYTIYSLADMDTPAFGGELPVKEQFAIEIPLISCDAVFENAEILQIFAILPQIKPILQEEYLEKCHTDF